MLRSYLIGALALSLSAPSLVAAQGSTDLFHVRLNGSGASLTVEGVERLTRRAGYDNQPAFLPDGSGVYFTRIDDAGQADIYRHDFASGAAAQVTRTAPESEYSATPIPGTDRFSVIRVEADSTQRLWSFSTSGADPRVLVPSLAPVGYQAWANESTLVLFVLGSPATLQIASPERDDSRVVTENIGRSIQKAPDSDRVTFLQRGGPDGDWVTEVDPETDVLVPLIRIRPGNEYFTWTPGGTLLTGEGSKLYFWVRGEGEEWTEFADLTDVGVTGITRMATSPDGTSLVIVGQGEGG